MSLFSQSLSENRRTLALAAPIIAGHTGQMLMGWADTIMVGRVGVVPLAACAFANTVLAVPIVFGFGLLAGVSVRASHAYGAGKERQSGEALRFGLLLALVAGLLVALGITLGLPLIPLLGQGEEVDKACVNFLVLCAWSVIPVFITTAAKSFCEALSRPWAPFWIVMGGVLLNVVLNWIFIYGNLGAPAMGLDGAGVATLAARIVTALCVLGYVLFSVSFAPYRPLHWLAADKLREMAHLLRIGLPTGGMHLAEVGGFAFGSIMMGWLSVQALAAHQIAITCAATAFMAPLGLSQAVAVRIGQARGRQELWRCRPIIFGALGVIVLVMTATMAAFIGGGHFIASVFVSDGAVVLLATQLLVFAGLFQIVDGVQIICSGGLRGFEDTRVPMLIGILSYWVVALPVSYFTAFHLKVGPSGVWIGFLVGLTVAAGSLFSRIQLRLRKIH